MKVIAAINSTRFLVEAGADELCMVMGYDSNYHAPEDAKPRVGKSIAVSRLYGALSVERHRQRKIKELADGLRRQADAIDSINAALDVPIIEGGA